MEILSQEGKTRELIDGVTTVAKCGKRKGGLVTAETASERDSVAFSDEWSLSSSRNASSSHDFGLDV